MTDITPKAVVEAIAAERRENATDLHITLDDAKESAALAVGRQLHMQMLDKPAYPPQTEPERLTLLQWIFGFPARYMARAEKQGKAQRARMLRVLIDSKKAYRESLPQQALAKKHAAQLDYTVALSDIACWEKVEHANAGADIKRLEAELELLEAEQCA